MHSLYKKMTAISLRHRSLGYIFMAVFGLAFFGLMQANRTFADPDSFYHAKMAVLMLKQGIVRDFPWLAYTSLPQIYTDHHFLYHVLLIPFVKFFSPLIGIKIATVLINTIFVLLFYYFLRKNKIPRPYLFVFLLLSAAPFIFRIDLDKANGLSLVFVMLILIFIFQKKYWPLAPLSFLYVWAYGGWPLGIFLAGMYFVASCFTELILPTVIPAKAGIPSLSGGSRIKCGMTKIWIIIKQTEWQPLLFSIGGSLAGLIINPYFPQNLKFYWIQIVQIAVINYQTAIGVGAEWYRFDLAELITYSGPLILVFVLGMIFFFGKIFLAKDKNVSRGAIKDIFFFILAAGAFFILTLKSCRNTEYFFPFAVMAAAFLIKYFYNKELLIYFKKKFLEIVKKNFFYLAFVIYIFLMFILSFGANFWRVKSALAQGFSFDYYREAMAVAEANSRPGGIIFHSDWDDWPMLFYHNDYNRYIVGLDTTFMYKYSPELYKKWRDITWGDFAGDSYSIIKNDFHAALIFIAQNDIDTMDKYFKNDVRYKLLYDKEGKVYKIN